MNARAEWVRHYTGVSTVDPSTLLPPGFTIPGLTTPLPQSVASPAFMWDQDRGEKLLTQLQDLGGATPNPMVMTADDFRQVCMTMLVHAELMAASAGLAVGIPTDSTDPAKAIGYVIGGAYDRAKASNTQVGRAYVEMFDAVQAALSASASASDSETLTIGSDFQHTIAPAILIALVVVGIAALAAGAYVLVQKIEIDSNASERLARASMVVDLTKAGKPIPAGLLPDAPKPGDPNAAQNGLSGALGTMGTGLAILGVAIVVSAVLGAHR